MDLFSIGALCLMGVFAGFAAGLFGIGGGMLMVPFMTALLAHLHFPSTYRVKVALATSLTTIAFTSLSSMRAHHRRGAVRWDVVRGLAPGILCGSFAGAHLAGALPPNALALFFGLFLCVMASRMLRSAVQPPQPLQRPTPGLGNLLVAGTGIGALSALVGAGGGFLTVPFLTQRNMPVHNAIASSAACGFPIALAGALGYIWAGQGLTLPSGSLGYVFIPALLCIVPASMLTAPLGARAAHALPTQTLKQAFACLLLVLSLYMLLHAVTA